MTTLEVVRDIYESFGRGDIQSILRHMSDDVEWEYG
jgi:ketosteroid isomerase-like protein